MVTIKADRPVAPGYFVRSHTADLLPWSWALDVMTRAEVAVLSTVRPDGRAHAMPLWGVWLDDTYYMPTSMTSVKSRNLEVTADCVVTCLDGEDAVVIEGHAELVDTPPAFIEAFKAKFNVQEFGESQIWRVRPRVAFGFQSGENFYRSATRWRFTPDTG